MERVKLGRSGLEVTKIGFGGIPIQRLPEQNAMEVIKSALERGINWIDTANAYGNSEERIGKVIQSFRREEFLLFTKGAGKDPETIEKQIELSLKRLNVDYIDLYQFHLVPDRETWQRMVDNGTVERVLAYKKQGRLRHVGATAHKLEAALATIEHPEIEVLQFPLNFIMTDDGLKALEASIKVDAGFIAMKPFGGGELDDAPCCIRFLLQYPEVVTDPGFESVEQVEKVLSLCEEGAPLSERDRAKIEEYKEDVGTRFCRRCGYCSPCEHGVDIIPLMTMESMIKRFPAETVLNGDQSRAVESHENCTDCGECEEKCPYELPIRERMKAGVEMFRELKSRFNRRYA